MKEYSSCKAAIDACISQQYFAVSHLYNDDKPMNMHIHDCYEIYYSVCGGKQFLIDNRSYSIQGGDIFFINQYESHHLSKIDKEVHERIVLSIFPAFLKTISSAATDLNYCFSCREQIGHKLSLNMEQQKRFLYYIHKIPSASGFGSDLVERAAFTELMVFLNRIFYLKAHEDHGEEELPSYKTEESPSKHQQVDDILTYINQNIQKPLTIEELSSHFYLSSSYICRIFKANTGTTINKYITAKRITIAKILLADGYTVGEACVKIRFQRLQQFSEVFHKGRRNFSQKICPVLGLIPGHTTFFKRLPNEQIERTLCKPDSRERSPLPDRSRLKQEPAQILFTFQADRTQGVPQNSHSHRKIILLFDFRNTNLVECTM